MSTKPLIFLDPHPRTQAMVYTGEVARTLDGMMMNSHLKRHNYFYYNCMMGHFTKDNCPSYLKPENFQKLKDGAIDKLFIENGTFMDALAMKKYTKVGLGMGWRWVL